jgi:hypothetical protein
MFIESVEELGGNSRVIFSNILPNTQQVVFGFGRKCPLCHVQSSTSLCSASKDKNKYDALLGLTIAKGSRVKAIRKRAEEVLERRW